MEIGLITNRLHCIMFVIYFMCIYHTCAFHGENSFVSKDFAARPSQLRLSSLQTLLLLLLLLLLHVAWIPVHLGRVAVLCQHCHRSLAAV